MTERIRLGISTCPNDTFAFHALLQHEVDWRGLDFQVQLLDIQQLNERLQRGELEVAKASFFAALRLSRHMLVLPSGSALGYGVGPLLLSSEPGAVPTHRGQLTFCPGRDTTASLLFELFYPASTRIEQVVFSEIMPALRSRRADFGVCIHEGRFTWREQSLHLVEDLGTRWEQESGCPLPLGGILADRGLGGEVLDRVQAVIRDSIAFALEQPTAALPTMRYHAQEFSDQVLLEHVKLYVNEWTLDLGEVGRQALRELSRRAAQSGLLPEPFPELEIHGAPARGP